MPRDGTLHLALQYPAADWRSWHVAQTASGNYHQLETAIPAFVKRAITT
jgi:hypothetical protein